jgi:hypothetical protein
VCERFTVLIVGSFSPPARANKWRKCEKGKKETEEERAKAEAGQKIEMKEVIGRRAG